MQLRNIRWHRPLARSRTGLFAAAAFLAVSTVVAFHLAADWMLTSSTSQVGNILCLVGLVVLLLLAAWTVGMAGGTLLLGDTWRTEHLVGEAYSRGDRVDQLIAEHGDRATHFLGMVGLSGAFLFVAAGVASGFILFNYGEAAEPLTMMRSSNPELQIRGATNAARPMQHGDEARGLLREQVAELLDSDSEEVRARAALSAGMLQIATARDRLIELTRSDQPAAVRAQAVEALARLQSPVAERHIVDAFPGIVGDEELEEPWLAALAIAAEPEASAVIVEHYDNILLQNRPLAVFAVGEGGDVCHHTFIMNLFEEADDQLACALGDAIKRVSVDEDVAPLQQLVEPENDLPSCDYQLRRSAEWRELGSGATLVVSAKMPLRRKLMEAMFNTAQPGMWDYYLGVLQNEDHTEYIRERAFHLAELWDDNLERDVRVAEDCPAPEPVPDDEGAAGTASEGAAEQAGDDEAVDNPDGPRTTDGEGNEDE